MILQSVYADTDVAPRMHAHTTYSTQNARPGGLCIAAAAALKAAVAKRSIGSGSTSVSSTVKWW